MARRIAAGMILTVLMVLWVQTGSAVEFSVEPIDPSVLNGTDLTLNCTLTGPLDGRTAADIDWVACPFYARCSAVEVNHSVEVVDNRTSLLHLRDLRMPREGEEEGVMYNCCFDCGTTASDMASKVYVGVPPYPVENLHCSGRNLENFTCSWENNQYTGLGIKKTYVQYRQRIGNKLREMTLGQNARSFSGQAFTYEMEIRVTQENSLGNSTAALVFYSRATDTIPNPPEGVELRFLKGEDSTVDLLVTWELPQLWLKEDYTLLVYKVDYKHAKTNKSFTAEAPAFPHKFTLHRVEPYTNYTLRLACKLSGAREWSNWSPLITGLSPEAAPTEEVLKLNQSIVGMNPNPYKRDVQLTWQPPNPDKRNGVIRGYELYISSSSLPQTINVSVTDNVYDLSDIDKFQQYDVQIAAYTTDGAVGPFSELVIPDLTREPTTVENLMAVSTVFDQILVTWDEPSNPHGEILRYTVKWKVVDPPGNVHINKSYDPSNRQFLIDGLLPFTKYKVMIVIHNKAGHGHAVEEFVTTRFSSPTIPRNLEHLRPSTMEIDLRWDPPVTMNGPPLGYKVRYWPSGDPSRSSINKSVSVTEAKLAVNCSAFAEAAQFTFQVSAVTGWDENDKLLGPAAVLEKEMCGASLPIPSIMMGILISAFSLLCLCFCMYYFRHSALTKPAPEPHFIDGILEHSTEKFMSRFLTRVQDKEEFDVLRTSESVHELVGQSNATSNKSSLSSSSGSSDQGFHEMQSDAEHYKVSFGTDQRRPNGQSELDVEQGQRMLSPTEEYPEDEVPVFNCPEDGDDALGPVNSYQTRTPTSPPASPASVHISMEGGNGVQYTSRRESLVGGRPSKSPASPHRLSSGSESGSMTYLQLGAHQVLATTQTEPRQDPGEESDTNYSQMAMQGTATVQTPPYESVWPSESTPEESDSHDGDLDRDWISGLRTDLGFNNNSKDIPDIHAITSFKPPQEIIVATALTPRNPDHSAAPKEASPLLPKLSSTDSNDYIDIVGSSSSPRANTSQISSPLMSPSSRIDAGCMDYVLQSELPPASPQETSVL